MQKKEVIVVHKLIFASATENVKMCMGRPETLQMMRGWEGGLFNMRPGREELCM